MQPAYAENQRKSEKKTLATCGMANSFTFAHFLFVSSLLFTFYFIRFCFIFFWHNHLPATSTSVAESIYFN